MQCGKRWNTEIFLKRLPFLYLFIHLISLHSLHIIFPNQANSIERKGENHQGHTINKKKSVIVDIAYFLAILFLLGLSSPNSIILI